MKLKKLIYSIATASMITPVAFGSFNPSTVQASTKGPAVSKKTAYKYTYKAAKTFKFNSTTTFKDFKVVSGVEQKNNYTLVNYGFGGDSSVSFKVRKIGNYIHVHTDATAKDGGANGVWVSADKGYYQQYGIKRNYTFKIKKHKHHKKSHVNYANKITSHDIKAKTYYGRKALVYYGFKHAGGVWTVNRNMDRVITFFKNSWSVWQGGEGGATNFTVKGKYVHFGQKTIGDQHKKPLIVKVSTVSKYVNKHGGKHMLKSIKKLGTLHQIETLTDNGQKIIQ